jgi:hypothetical protein
LRTGGRLREEVWLVAWMRMMGAESVANHRATVLERGDDYQGMALAYYASRGETPLVWGGSGAGALGCMVRCSLRGMRRFSGPAEPATPSPGCG